MELVCAAVELAAREREGLLFVEDGSGQPLRSVRS